MIDIPEKLGSESIVWTPEQLDAWTMDPWTQEIFTIFSDIYFFLSRFNVEFLNMLSALRLMCYGSVECTADDHYNANRYN